jgi:hypothetical protein
MCEIENGVAEHDHQLFVLALEGARQGVISGFDDRALSDPLPELRLRSPELFSVTADDESRLFALLTLFFDGPRTLPLLSSKYTLSLA